MAFKSTLIGAGILKLGTSILIKTLKTPPQWKFKKLAQAKQREYAFKMSLEDSDYDEYKSTLDATLGGQSHRPNTKVLTKEEFRILSSNLRKRKAVNRALLANDFDAYIVARKAEQPILPSKEEFANTK